MTLDKLNKLEKEVVEAYIETIKNITLCPLLKDNLKMLELKEKLSNDAKEIFENSLRMIKEQKEKLRGEI